jgi:Lon protease-like protein
MAVLEFPQRCGVMVLPDIVLFPQGVLPLYLFEERYRLMLEEAQEGNCFFAVTKRDEQLAHQANRLGTLGLIRASKLQENGHFHVMLHGLIRVEFMDWHEEKPYPMASILPRPTFFEPIHQAEAAMQTLMHLAEDALEHEPEDMKSMLLSMLEQAPNPEVLSDIIAQQFISDTDHRQKLLEMDNIADRITALSRLL